MLIGATLSLIFGISFKLIGLENRIVYKGKTRPLGLVLHNIKIQSIFAKVPKRTYTSLQ